MHHMDHLTGTELWGLIVEENGGKNFSCGSNMDCNKNALLAFKILKSQEDSSDCFSVAGVARKILKLNFFASVELNESAQAREFLINENFKDYAEVVDSKDPENVNNYTEYVSSLLPNFQNDERHNWKSHLSIKTVKKYLEPLSCSNDINCKNSEQCLTNFDNVKVAIAQYNKTNDVVQTELSNVTTVTVPIKTPVLNYEFNPRNIHSIGVKAQNVKTCYHQSIEKESESKDIPFFRTARDELQIQNAKKFGKSSNSVNEKTSQPPLKRSLGARKNGVFGKFQPPVRCNEAKDNEIKMEVDEVVDEKLKNIDPAMVELIKNEIMDCGSKITWNDIAGLHLAKSTIQEIVVWPMLRPDIFTGLRRPPKGILLFGPPGTGKTLIGKCIASQSNSTFFSISASSLTSKWVGEGEKMVRTLFAVAKVYQPSVIFIDEIDSLLTQRSDSDHESSRRIKTEFLVQLDGAGTGDEDRILIIGATNRPQELDEAARRRLVKRLYIPLPDEEARKQIIQNLISTERHSLNDSDIQNIAKLTKGYSGADVKNLCQEASLGPLRSIGPNMIHSISPEDVRPLNAGDFESALQRIKSSVSESDLNIYLAWDKQYGCGSGTN